MAKKLKAQSLRQGGGLGGTMNASKIGRAVLLVVIYLATHRVCVTLLVRSTHKSLHAYTTGIPGWLLASAMAICTPGDLSARVGSARNRGKRFATSLVLY